MRMIVSHLLKISTVEQSVCQVSSQLQQERNFLLKLSQQHIRKIFKVTTSVRLFCPHAHIRKMEEKGRKRSQEELREEETRAKIQEKTSPRIMTSLLSSWVQHRPIRLLTTS